MTVHSLDGVSWSTKLERIGELAREEKKTVFNNIGHCLDVNLLREIFEEMDGKKAVGIDGVSKAEYGFDVDKKLKELINRIRKGVYKPKASKVVEIAKEDGSTRPLAISCFEDKLVQSAVNKILTAIYEPVFLSCSYGYRKKQKCHDALRDLKSHTYEFKDGAIVEIDIRKYFDTIPHKELKTFLNEKIKDRRFLRLVDVLIMMPKLKEGKIIENKAGCSQGSILSPVLSNIYLHHVIDEWFMSISQTHMRGRTKEVRFADDMVFVFEEKSDAERFFKVLPKRLKKYGLEMHQEKSQKIESGTKAATRAEKEGKRLGTYKFLGFICYWDKARAGFWRLKYKSRGDRMTKKLHEIQDYLRGNLNSKDRKRLLENVIQRVRGWINYHGISDNDRKVNGFIWKARRIVFKWFNRRGGKRKMTYKRFNEIMKIIKFPITWKTVSMFPSSPK